MPWTLIVWTLANAASPTTTRTSYHPFGTAIVHAAPARIWTSVSSRWSEFLLRSRSIVVWSLFHPYVSPFPRSPYSAPLSGLNPDTSGEPSSWKLILIGGSTVGVVTGAAGRAALVVALAETFPAASTATIR